MPVDEYGQQITFASEIDGDAHYTRFVHVRTREGDSIKKIASRRGHPELAHEILHLNRHVTYNSLSLHGIVFGRRIRSTGQELPAGIRLKLPGTLRKGEVFSVLCGDERPTIKDGYAMYDTVNRPGRIGLNRFLGYNPVEMDLAVQFEGYSRMHEGAGKIIENKIAILERMAGRGNFHGAATGPPAVLRISVTGPHGNIVPLIPLNYQWSRKNKTAPLYRVSSINWDAGALSDDEGRRVRATATISVKQFTPTTLVQKSATERNHHRRRKS